MRFWIQNYRRNHRNRFLSRHEACLSLDFEPVMEGFKSCISAESLFVDAHLISMRNKGDLPCRCNEFDFLLKWRVFSIWFSFFLVWILIVWWVFFLLLFLVLLFPLKAACTTLRFHLDSHLFPKEFFQFFLETIAQIGIYVVSDTKRGWQNGFHWRQPT